MTYRDAGRMASYLLVTLAIALAACGPAPATEPAPTASPATAPTSSPTAAASPTPSAVPLPTLPSLPEGPLSPEGPWVLIEAADGLWAVNPDGSGLTHVFDVTSLPECSPYPHTLAAPTGGHVAIIGPPLYVLALPGVHTEAFAELIPTPEAFAELIPTMEEGFIWCPRTVDYNVWLAVAGDTSAAWSSDGRYLAFNGAMDGPSADVYVYALEDGSITRLTTGPTQSVDAVWSPDDRYLVHGAADSMNWGMAPRSGYTMSGVWTVRPADGMTRLLFASDVIGLERVIGWISAATYLGDTCQEGYQQVCEDLRMINVETGQITSILPTAYCDRAFDPATQTLLIAKCGEPPSDLEPGLYLLGAAGGEPTPIQGIEPQGHYEILWSEEAGRFIVNTSQGLFAVNPAGDVIPIAPPAQGRGTGGIDAACSGTSCAAVREDGSLWVGTMGQELTRLWIGSVHGPTWSPDGQHLFFVDTLGDVDTLYVTQAPDFRPILTVATIVNPNGRDGFDPLTWVWP